MGGNWWVWSCRKVWWVWECVVVLVVSLFFWLVWFLEWLDCDWWVVCWGMGIWWFWWFFVWLFCWLECCRDLVFFCCSWGCGLYCFVDCNWWWVFVFWEYWEWCWGWLLLWFCWFCFFDWLVLVFLRDLVFWSGFGCIFVDEKLVMIVGGELLFVLKLLDFGKFWFWGFCLNESVDFGFVMVGKWFLDWWWKFYCV